MFIFRSSRLYDANTIQIIIIVKGGNLMKNKPVTKVILALAFVFIIMFDCSKQDNIYLLREINFLKLPSPSMAVGKIIGNTGKLFCDIGNSILSPAGVSANFMNMQNPPNEAFTKEELNDNPLPLLEQTEEKTISSTSGTATLVKEITIKNQTNYQVASSNLLEYIPFNVLPASQGPQVLIIHTHGTESFTPSENYNFSYTSNSRTTDNNYNVVRLGTELELKLKESGVNVIHDLTQYDYPDYNSSYDKAFYGIKSILQKYPSISIVLDIHRDAVSSDEGKKIKLTGIVDDKKAAQIMFVVGTDECGFSHPNWQKNLSFAAHLQQKLSITSPSLVRPINLRTSRFNQQFTPGSLIVEIGTNGNTLDEALLSIDYLAKAVKDTITDFS